MSGQRTKVSSIGSWLSPAGVITGGRLGFRMLCVFALIVLSMFVLGLSSQAENEAVQNAVDGIAAGFLLVGVPIAIWIILVSLTKHYRTKGVWAPFFFALITPFMPFMFFFTWIFSSKERAKVNIELAKEQAKVPKLERETVKDAPNPPAQLNQKRRLQGDGKSSKTNTQTVVRRMR